MNKNKDRRVGMTELKEIWAEVRANHEIQNGVTHRKLRERYGDRVYHVMGDGWYVRPEKDETTSRLATPGYKTLRAEYNVSWDGGDPWGSNIEWLFAISEFLTHEGPGTPAGWDFHDSPAHHGWEPDGYQEEMLADMWDEGEFTMDDALTFGHVLNRYDDMLRAAGLNY